MKNNIPHVSKMTKDSIKEIKLIVFDVDGVLVKRGTKIKQEKDMTTLQTKKIAPEQIRQLKALYEKEYIINISSGRGLYMLQDMFRAVLPYVSLTFENGSVTWYKGKVYQHINSFDPLKELYQKLLHLVKDKRVKGFEPKEFILTLHCWEQVPEVEKIVAEHEDLTTIWNGEAYDIQIKDIHSKGAGVESFRKVLGLEKKNVLAIGDNYNDKELLDEAEIAVTADKSRLDGDFYVPLNGERLPADILMEQILKVS